MANAFYIDPKDQSAWMYHRWLLGRTEQPPVLGLIGQSETGGRIYLGFSQRCLVRRWDPMTSTGHAWCAHSSPMVAFLKLASTKVLKVSWCRGTGRRDLAEFRWYNLGIYASVWRGHSPNNRGVCAAQGNVYRESDMSGELERIRGLK